jgi:hypothetical protein
MKNETMMTKCLNFAVKALQDIRNSLIDINKNLSNWRRGDPCTSNWTGVLCFNTTKEDAYLHVRELYDSKPQIFISFSVRSNKLPEHFYFQFTLSFCFDVEYMLARVTSRLGVIWCRLPNFSKHVTLKLADCQFENSLFCCALLQIT